MAHIKIITTRNSRRGIGLVVARHGAQEGGKVQLLGMCVPLLVDTIDAEITSRRSKRDRFSEPGYRYIYATISLVLKKLVRIKSKLGQFKDRSSHLTGWLKFGSVEK